MDAETMPLGSPRKRPSPSSDEDTSATKRRKVRQRWIHEPVEAPPPKIAAPTFNEQARLGLRRGILLALERVGFDSATDEALESFTHMTETYIGSLAEDIRAVTNSARRSYATSVDYEICRKRFNLDTPLLLPHLKTPIQKTKLRPTYSTQLFLDEGESIRLPCLDEELNGKADKEAKEYIPQSFPEFPSAHTYKYTPIEAESVTVQSFLPYGSHGAAPREVPDWHGDPKKIREEGARQAKQGEDALRSLVRASKVSHLKGLRSNAEKDPITKKRYDEWEDLMREVLEENGSVDSRSKGALGAGAARLEIADHSMIVNSQKQYQRREITRTTKRMGDGIIGKG